MGRTLKLLLIINIFVKLNLSGLFLKADFDKDREKEHEDLGT